MSNAQKRIAGALLAGAALIAGALLLRSYQNTNTTVEQNAAVVVTAPQRTAIKTLDENGDGVPDWQESLLVTQALSLASTTDYTAPETLTGQFALDFFENIVRAENYGAFGDSPDELVIAASNRLAQSVIDKLYTIEDITVSENTSLDAITSYGETIAEITTRYPGASLESEVLILERALRDQNSEELDALDGKITVYQNIIQDTLALPVPNSYTTEHLNLINSYQAILNDIVAMRNAFTDPMLTLLRMKRYQDDANGLSFSFSNIFTKLQTEGATWNNDSPVYLFIQ